MDLYFSPLAGSLASRIAFYEARAHVRFIEVDSLTKRTADGIHFAELYPLGLVPLLRLDEGSLLSENAAILQYVADRFPDAKLTPNNGIERARLQQWLSFIGMELHQGLFCRLFDQSAPDGTRTQTLQKSETRLKYLNDHLGGREFLLDASRSLMPIYSRSQTGVCRHALLSRLTRVSKNTVSAFNCGPVSPGHSKKNSHYTRRNLLVLNQRETITFTVRGLRSSVLRSKAGLIANKPPYPSFIPVVVN